MQPIVCKEVYKLFQQYLGSKILTNILQKNLLQPISNWCSNLFDENSRIDCYFCPSLAFISVVIW